MAALRTVWIEVHCIGCQACANGYPAIFSQPAGRAEILGCVRVDGRTSDNEAEQAELNEQGQLRAQEILEAAAGCPVEAVRVARDPELRCGDP